MPDNAILDVQPLGFPWQTQDPFLFCVYHDDAYPRGNEVMGPAASLAGRELGQDFSGKDGWRMYHGTVVPGFPAHPHRGFETVTIVRRGLIDHSDSLGATARFGGGDVQWLTAGQGIVHAEMFPLLDRDQANPLELFQIWLNLPASHKMVSPYFRMLWSHTIPKATFNDGSGGTTEVACIAGRLGEMHPPSPPPDSWASQADAEVAIWTIKMNKGARWVLPAAKDPRTHRNLYLFKGGPIIIDGRSVAAPSAIGLRATRDVELVNTGDVTEILLLQGKPIGEPVAQHGPFVMNTPAEIRQAFADYQRTHFGGWPWPDDAPVHAREQARFAKHVDGSLDVPQ